MNSCDFRVFLQEFGTTVHLSLPGSVSEKERLLLKLLMQGMSVTEISQYRNRSAKEGANKRGNSSRLTQSFHFFMFEPIFSPVNALNQPI